MALQKSMAIPVVVTKRSSLGIVSENNDFVNVDNVYIKVERVSGTKNAIMFEVLMQADTVKQAASYEFTPNMNGSNFIKQAYEYLKTLPEYSGAIDC
jgi:hypothetical protein